MSGGKLEGSVQREVWLDMSQGSTTLFRLNTGKGWLSNLGPKGVHRLADGSVHVEAPRPIALGFGMVSGDPVNGACDLPGWTEVVVTQEMVGKKIAVFTSVETKRTKGGKASEDQLNWRDRVWNAGGIAVIANSPAAAREGLAAWYRRFKV